MAQEAITRQLTALLTGYLIKNLKIQKMFAEVFSNAKFYFYKINGP